VTSLLERYFFYSSRTHKSLIQSQYCVSQHLLECLVVVMVKVKKHVIFGAARQGLAFPTRLPSHRDVLRRAMRELFFLHTSYFSISAVPSSSSSIWNTLVISLLTSQSRISGNSHLMLHWSPSLNTYNASRSLHSHEWGLLTVMVGISPELFVVACL
jgi:hypothetical protein